MNYVRSIKISRILGKYLIDDLSDIVLQYAEKNLWEIHDLDLFDEDASINYNDAYNKEDTSIIYANEYDHRRKFYYNINKIFAENDNFFGPIMAWSWCENDTTDEYPERCHFSCEKILYPLLYLQIDAGVCILTNFQKEYENILKEYLKKKYIYPLETCI
jgi:hypothetical protein